MNQVFVYYENCLKNFSSSTTVYFEVFSDYEKAHNFMLSRRDEILKNSNWSLDKNETGHDKSWLRIHTKDNYIDLIIEEKEIK